MNIPVATPKLGSKEVEYVMDCLKSGWISSKGKYVDLFEENFSKYVGVKHGIAVSSGTASLHIALASLGIRRGDEVIIPTFTMIAVANSVMYVGAKPVLIDSESKTWNIDPSRIESKITRNTKAIIVAHIYGHPADLDPILKTARSYGLYVIEDAAEAHGAEYRGKKVGGIGDVGCFSFYANKIITTGEGGMIVTDDYDIAERARKLRDQFYNRELREWLIHDGVGFNYRMTNLQAALGLAQLEKIEEFVRLHRKNAHYYNSMLKDVPGLTLPPESNWAKNVYWMYTVLIQDEFGVPRDELMRKLKKEFNIDTRATFHPIHLQPPYCEFYSEEKYPVAEELGKKGINLPSGNTLTKEEIEYVVNAIISIKREGRKWIN